MNVKLLGNLIQRETFVAIRQLEPEKHSICTFLESQQKPRIHRTYFSKFMRQSQISWEVKSVKKVNSSFQLLSPIRSLAAAITAAANIEGV